MPWSHGLPQHGARDCPPDFIEILLEYEVFSFKATTSEPILTLSA